MASVIIIKGADFSTNNLDKLDTIGLLWEQGAIAGTSGLEDNTTRIRTNINYYKALTIGTHTFSCDSPYQVAVYSYDGSSYKFVSGSWATSSSWTADESHTYAFVMRHSDNSDITPSEVESSNFSFE